MNTVPDPTAKGIKTLDRDLRRIGLMEQALAYMARPLVSVGLVLFGPKLINIVGSEITRLNAMRAYCVRFYREWYHEQILVENRDMSALTVEERMRRKVVRRSHLPATLAAWVITVPAPALLPAGLFLVLARIGGAG